MSLLYLMLSPCLSLVVVKTLEFSFRYGHNADITSRNIDTTQIKTLFHIYSSECTKLLRKHT